MSLDQENYLGFAVALAIGILIGIERERSKGVGPERDVAGVRTFSLAALVGAISFTLGGAMLFAVFALVLGALIAMGYRKTRDTDPGLTTEVALVATALLGALATREQLLSAALAVLIAIILAARTRLHNWIHNALTETEINDGLMLLAAALIVLPLAPSEPLDPWGIASPRKLWSLVVLIMAINALGYIALRTIGPRIGLVLAGLLSGFVSSTATIGAMGSRTREHPELHAGAVAGAAASSVATVIQLALFTSLVSWPVFLKLIAPLAGGGIAALGYAAFFTLRSAREAHDRAAPPGRAFDPKTAIVFVLIVAATLVASAALTEWLGGRGLLIASALAGFSDAHAAAISAATLSQSGHVTVEFAAIAALAALTTNTLSKSVVAFAMGTRQYALELLPGLLLILAGTWLGWLAGRVLQS
jgi:uncharacterized membrane protein (DUF4010 family)